MAPKRKDRELSEDAPPAKKFHTKDESHRKHQTRSVLKKAIQTPRNERAVLSVNELKRRIRDVKRLLEKVDLPPEGRITQERALTGYQRDLDSEMAKRKRSEMIKKYHFVRFLERKTATKELKKLLRREREISESDSPAKEEDLKLLAPRIHTARVNVNYTIYSPLTEKYISLYPNKNRTDTNGNNNNSDVDGKEGADSEDKRSRSESQQPQDYHIQANESGEKPPLWYTVEKCMADNTLDLLREGKLNIGADGKKNTSGTSSSPTLAAANPSTAGKKASKTENKKSKKDVKTNAAHREEDEDEDGGSDGGFFEE